MDKITEQRKIAEKEFHDRLRINSFGQRWSTELEEEIKKNPFWVNMKYYSIERRSREFVLNWLKNECRGKRVLDYCCGNGEDAFFAAQNGAREVMGIDISDVSIANCQNRAVELNISKTAGFKVMDAEDLKFEDNSFDVVTEYGCLHHLVLEQAFKEIARVLIPKGKAICNEALGHNLLIGAYRKLTPNLRTKFEAEHILKNKDIELAKKYFYNVECYFFHFFTLLAVPMRNLPCFNVFLSVMEFLDDFALKIPVLKWQAWQAVIVLSNPKFK